MNDNDALRDACNKCTQVPSDVARCHRILSGAFFGEGNLPAATDHAMKAVQLRETADHLANLGVILIAAGDEARGFAELQRAIALDGNSVHARRSLGSALYNRATERWRMGDDETLVADDLESAEKWLEALPSDRRAHTVMRMLADVAVMKAVMSEDENERVSLLALAADRYEKCVQQRAANSPDDDLDHCVRRSPESVRQERGIGRTR